MVVMSSPVMSSRATPVRATAVPATAVPATAVPATAVPATAVPATAVPAAAVPAAAVQVRPIPPDVLSQLRERDDAGHQPRLLTDRDGGSPLRCCLRRIRPGERVALVSYAPLRRWAQQTGADPGPYDEIGPVFIHPEPCPGPGGSGYPPDQAGSRRVLRAYSADGRILGGRLVEPTEIADGAAGDRALAEALADPQVAVVHVRAVEFGCFQFEARRGSPGDQQDA